MTLNDANAINKRMIDVWQKWKLDQITQFVPVSSMQGLAQAHGQLIEYNPSKFTPTSLKDTYRMNVSDYQVNQELRLYQARYNPAVTPDQLQEMSINASFTRHLALTNADKAAEQIITHEMGHVVQDQLIGGVNLGLLKWRYRQTSNTAMMLIAPRRIPESQALYDRWNSIFQQAGPRDFLKVSNYSRVNQQEYFAESFLMYNNEPQNLPSNVKSFFDDLLKFARKP